MAPSSRSEPWVWAFAVLCATVLAMSILVVVHSERSDAERLRACASIRNEVTRTSCVNGWHGP